MRYEARVSAYDMLDKVHAAVVVMASDGAEEGHLEVVLRIATTVDGEGEMDPRAWLRDALIAVLEEL